MKYFILRNKNKHGIKFFRKIFYNIFFMLDFEKIKKRSFFIITSNYKKITTKKYLSTETLFIHKTNNIGMKIHSFVKNKKKYIPKKSLDNFLDLWTMLSVFYVFFEKIKKKNNLFSPIVKFYISYKHEKKKVFKFSFNFMTKISQILFEESANEIKFIFDINFAKAIFLQNPILQNCWVISNLSFDCFLEYCKNYIFACYSSMTKCKRFLKKHQTQGDSVNFLKYDKYEYDFFHIKKNVMGHNLNIVSNNSEIFSNKYNSKSNEYYLKWKKKNIFESIFFYKIYNKDCFKKNLYIHKVLFY